ncbi:S8 family serine peptidase, partial [bacterium]|nr:S8 family serine peptidase [bacterium]
MKSVSVLVLTCSLLIGLAASGLAFENSSVVGQVPDRIVVTLKPGVAFSTSKAAGGTVAEVPAMAELASRFEIHNVEPLYAGLTAKIADKSVRRQLDRTLAIDFPASMGLERVRAAFAASGLVEDVRLVDICRNYGYLPNDPALSGSQWYARNMTAGGADVRAVGAWNQALGDSNVMVAIVDSGVDWQHPDLGGSGPDHVNGAIWTNWAEYYGTAGVDDDSNGKIDDIRGWDFVNVPGGGWPGEDDSTPDNDPMDYESHGTACAGCVGGIGNNGIGIAGVAHGVKIMPVRVGWLPNGSTQGVVRMDFASQGIIYAATNGAKVINCSWGSTSYLAGAVSLAVSYGAIVVTAAGNDNAENDSGLGVPSYLSTHPNVLSVAATQQSDLKASFSNFGTWVELSAPGVGIYTTWYDRNTANHTYSSVDGTSFSSPITCAAAALIWSANPGLTRTEVTDLLLGSCDNLDALNPTYAGKLGAGRVNLLRALGDRNHLVPDEFSNSFDALNEASTGDTISITATASVTSPMVVPNRDLKVLGGFSSDFTTRDPVNDPTVVIGNGANSVLRFQGAVGQATVIDGFRMSGGGGSVYSGIPFNARYGGGAMVRDASPTLRNLEISGCSVGSQSELGCGGGMALINSSAILENVSVHDNTGTYGAGIFIYNSTVSMDGCTIADNTGLASNLTYPPLGGGLHVIDGTVTLNSCDVTGHTGLNTGGGVYLVGSGGVSNLDWTGGMVAGNTAVNNGAGLYMSGGTASLHGVTFDDNSPAPGGGITYGGGAYFGGVTFAADSLVFTGNSAGIGGGLNLQDCPQADLSHSVLTGNTASYLGGGLNFQNNPSGTLSGNTAAANVGAGLGGGGIYVTGVTPAMEHNLMAFNTGGTTFGNGLVVGSAPAVFSCNDAYGNAGADYTGFPDPTGTDGNISVDPVFCDAAGGNYGLKSTSPCTAANNPGCGLIGALDVCAASPVPDEGD